MIRYFTRNKKTFNNENTANYLSIVTNDIHSKEFDKIFVIKDGEIIEHRSNDYLIEKQNYFYYLRKLFN